ncbi:MAG: DMT family transporter [Bacteroidetes bacterium]|nr:DMT family transporter [Bacteroidota bacterium]
MSKLKIQAHFALLVANIIYSINYTVAKDVMPFYIGPSGFVLIRATGALLLFWLSGLLVKNEKIAFNDFGKLLLCGLFGVAINQLFFFEGLSLTSPINAAIIMVSTPILVLVFSSIIIKEKVTGNKVAGIILGVSGALLLIIGNSSIISGIQSNPLGDTFIFLNAASYAVYLVLVKSLMKKYSALTVIKWVFLFGIVFVIPIGFSQATAIEWAEIPQIIWYAIAFVVFGTTFLAYLLNTFALKAVSPTVTAVYIYLQPLLAAMIALMFGKDELDLIKVGSAILIFTGVYLVSRKRKVMSLES